MGGKNKNRRKHQQRSTASTATNYTHKLSQEQLCQLVAQCTQIQPFLVEREQRLKKVDDFAYILSTKWLKQWKEYVGYESLFSSTNQSDKKMGKKMPSTINSDIITNNRQFFEVPEELPQYDYLNIVINEKYDLNQEYIAVDEETWNKFITYYEEAKEIRRPIRKPKSGKVFVDGELFSCDVIFINYDEEFEDKIDKMKNIRKNIDQLIPCNKMQFSRIWQFADLDTYIDKYCKVRFGIGHSRIWKVHNFIGALSLQEMFAKNVKEQTYEIYAQQITEDWVTDLDLDQFLKSEYILVIEVNGQRIKEAKIPQDLHGYCQSCIEKRSLTVTCDCGMMFYCSEECRSDDQTWHYKLCEKAFDSEDDEEYEGKGKPKVPVCGLKNLGNTCYMNSSMQMLLSLDFLRNYFLVNGFYEQEVEKAEEMFLRKLGKFIKKTAASKDQVIPWSLKGQINYHMPPFSGYKQHDADDFIVNFINLLNDCLPKDKEAVYHPIIKDTFMGMYDSIIICPECGIEVKNQEPFLQVTVPIKQKGKKVIYNYAIFQSPYAITYGRAELLTSWDQILNNVKVEGECFIGIGNDGEDGLICLDTEDKPETILKKYKKNLIFYPGTSIKEHEVWFSVGFISIKYLCGQSMKACYGYPFPVIIDAHKTVIELVTAIISKLFPTQELDLFMVEFMEKMLVLKQKRQKKRKSEEETSETKETEVEEKKEEKEEKKKKNNKDMKEEKKEEKDEEGEEGEEQKDIEESIISSLMKIMKKMGMKIYIEDQKRIKNICYFCSKKCNGCELALNLQSIKQYFSHKVNEVKIEIYLQEKPEIIKINKDICTSGDSTIQDCFELFKEPQQLDEENAWYCFQCQDMRLAYKQLRIITLPRYLLIHLNRFKNDVQGKAKNTEPILYEEEEVFGEKRYKLVGVVVHEGSMEGGHYWSICYRQDSYYIFNDEKVSKTNKTWNKNAYILCYRQM